MNIRNAIVGSLHIALWGAIGSAVANPIVQDTGYISEYYANQNGNVAILLSNGFPNAKAAIQCPRGNGYAGTSGDYSVTNAALKAALLTAKAMGSRVRVGIDASSCIGDDAWWRIVDVYILD